MKEKFFEILGIVIAVSGVVILIFSGFQAHIMDTQKHLEYLVLNHDTMGLCIGLGLGAIFGGLSLVNDATFF